MRGAEHLEASRGRGKTAIQVDLGDYLYISLMSWRVMQQVRVLP